MNSQKIIDVASQYVGLYEIVPNAKWTSKTAANPSALSDKLLSFLDASGWEPGWPYCMAFVEAVYSEAFASDPKALKKIKQLLSPSVMSTYKACKPFITKTPTPGAIFVMQKGNGGFGHAGIVVAQIAKDKFSTIEGNTSPAPASAEADRNGDGIYAKSRKLAFENNSGLHLIGFIDFSSIMA